MADQFVKLCSDGDLEGVQVALQNGSDVNCKDWSGMNGLVSAWLNKHTAVANLLMAQEGIEAKTVDCAKAEVCVNLCSEGNLEGISSWSTKALTSGLSIGTGTLPFTWLLGRITVTALPSCSPCVTREWSTIRTMLLAPHSIE